MLDLGGIRALALGLVLSASATGQDVVLRELNHLGIDDFEITPDGRYAVGRENRINTAAVIVDLISGNVVAQPGGTPGVGVGWSGFTQDAVALTNERAIVLGNSALVVDLTNLAAPILFEHTVGVNPRDVALTPNGTLAYVRGGTGPTGGQFVIDVTSGAVLSAHMGNEPVPNPPPTGSLDVDCVAASDTHAVMTSYLASGPSTRVTIWKGTSVAFETIGGSDLLGGPHDVAITPDGTLAVVRSEAELAAFDLTVSPPALAFRRGITGGPGPFFDVALDSLEVTNQYFVTVARNSNPQLGSFGTQVEVFDRNGLSGYDRIAGVPHDLTLTPDGTRALVRTSAGVFLYDLTSFAAPLFPAADSSSATGAGTGYFAGMDSIVASDDVAVAILQVPGLSTVWVRIWNIEGGTLQPMRSPLLTNTRPLDIVLTPDSERAVVAGTNSVSVVHVKSGTVTFYDQAHPVTFYYPWCDGAVSNGDFAVGFGYWGGMQGWFEVLDLRGFDSNYCVATPNSTGNSARISALGSASVGANDLSLVVDGAPPRAIGLFRYASSTQQTPFGEGQLCLASTTFDAGVVVTTFAGAAGVNVDLTNPSSSGGQVFSASTWHYQFFFRDPGGGPAGFNTSDGTTVTFGP
jgi:hypothetical protein